ncbi:MAG: HPr family phosphocarrier protein [Butyricicoccaceae bacterium]
MLTERIRLPEEFRFHARPAASAAKEAQRYRCMVFLTANGRFADARNAISIMRLGKPEDGCVEVTADGEDETEAVQAIKQVLMTTYDG